MPESARIGESERYFAANQPMRYVIQIANTLEEQQCILQKSRTNDL